MRSDSAKYRRIEIVHASNLPPDYAIVSIDFTNRHDSMAKDATIRPKVESVDPEPRCTSKAGSREVVG